MLKLVAYLGLALVLIAPVLVYAGALDAATCKTAMLVGTVLWLGAYTLVQSKMA